MSPGVERDWPGLLACLVRRAVREATGLTCSLGVGPNRFLSKIASDMRKPAGVTVVHRDDAQAFVSGLGVQKLRGVGPVMAEKLRARGIATGADLLALGRDGAGEVLGEFGAGLYAACVGEPPIGPVRAGFGYGEGEAGVEVGRKSISHERTFSEDVRSRAHLHASMASLVAKTAFELRAKGLSAGCVTVRVRLSDFSTHQRDEGLGACGVVRSDLDADFLEVAHRLLNELLDRHGKGGPCPAVRLIGCKLSRLATGGGRQLRLGETDIEQRSGVLKVADAIRRKHGFDAVRSGAALPMDKLRRNDGLEPEDGLDADGARFRPGR